MRIKKLYSFLKGHLISIIILIVIVIFQKWSYSYVPLFTQTLIQVLTDPLNEAFLKINLPNSYLKSIPVENLLNAAIYIAISLILWQIVRYIILYFESYYKGKVQERITSNLRIDLYRHIQNLPYSFHKNADTGDLIQRVTSDVETTTRFVVVRTLDVIGLIASIIIGVMQMYYLNTTIMFISLIAIPFTAAASIIYFKKVDKLLQDVEEKESKMMSVIQENISASKVVKAFGNEAYEVKKMKEKNEDHKNINIKTNKIVSMYWGGMDFFMMLQYSAVIIVGIISAKNGHMEASAVAAALMLVGMLIWPVRGLGRIINDLGKAIVASDRIHYLFDMKEEYDLDGTLTPQINGNIIFKDVSFKFADSDKYLLKNINFEITQGKTVSIIGKTGSGKSTIINILLRHYDYEGSILIDGCELRDIKKTHIRKNIGIVLQDVFLFSKSVYENIGINNVNDDSKIFRASKIASLEKDINTFSRGYETLVGEKGATLSGGQKQRVAIARAVIDYKPILIFDDSLSALDNNTETNVRKELKENLTGATTIMITHRITTAKESDLIIVLNNNELEAIGTHNELSSQEGLYKELWDIQGMLEDEFIKLLEKEGV